MATGTVLTSTPLPATVPESSASPSASPESTYTPATFDPAVHLRCELPSSSISLTDLALDFPNASSQIAITAPFPLLTAEGVREVRADIFRRDIVAKYGSWKYPGVYRIRGYGPAAPFTYAMWRSAEMLEACSRAAGVDLDIIMDYELGQLNVQLPAHDGAATITDYLPPRDPPRPETDDTVVHEGADLKDLVSAWHHDSYPWVCVVMLSDPVNMSGGETALRRGDGGILKMRQPGMGYAVMMQGSLVSHAALRTLGTGERITFVVSFRPRDPLLPDTSNLRTVKGISNVDELFRQWTCYRLDVVAQRAARMCEQFKSERRPATETRQLIKEWMDEQTEYLQTTVSEMSM